MRLNRAPLKLFEEAADGYLRLWDLVASYYAKIQEASLLIEEVWACVKAKFVFDDAFDRD